MKARWLLAALVSIGMSTAPGGSARAAGDDKTPAATAQPGGPKPAEGSGAKKSTHHHDSADDDDTDEVEPPAVPDPLVGVPHIVGPKQVELGHGAVIDLPEGLALLEQAMAQDMERKLGNDASTVVAVVMAEGGVDTWNIVIRAADVGHVSDAEAGTIDPDVLLDQLQHGARAHPAAAGLGSATGGSASGSGAAGEPALDAWIAPPRYNATRHRLTWSLRTHDGGSQGSKFSGRLLGRAGYLAVDLVNPTAAVAEAGEPAWAVLDAIQLKSGSRYEDYTAGDKDAGLGLRALVFDGEGVVEPPRPQPQAQAQRPPVMLMVAKKGLIVVLAAVAALVLARRISGRRTRRGGSPPPA